MMTGASPEAASTPPAATISSEVPLRLHEKSARAPSTPPRASPHLATTASDAPALHNLQSPLRQHKRAPSTHHHEVKETLDARVEYGSDDEDGRTYHKINQYTMLEEVGRGSYGAVHLAIDQFGKEFAIKEFSKSRLRKRAQSEILRHGPRGRPKRQALRSRCNGQTVIPWLGGGERPGGEEKEKEEDALYLIREEVAIMKKLHHPNLVQLIEVLDDPDEDSIYMVLEMCKKGVVMKVGLDHDADPYSDDACRYYFRDLMLGIEYLHSQSIVHRDIKPDNLLIGEDDTLKIVDFGVSEMFEKPDGMKIKKSAGSPAFLAPELCSPHGEVSGTAADIWSMGVCLYCFRYGKIPFHRASVLDMYHAIQTEQPKFPADEDAAFIDVLKRLLEKDPEERITMEQLREHAWVTKKGTDELLCKLENCAHKVEPPNELEINRAFTRKMNNVFCVVKAITKFKSLLSDGRCRRPGVDSAAAAEEEEDGYDAVQATARAEEIESLLTRRRQVLSQGAQSGLDGNNSSSSSSSNDKGDRADEWQAKEISNQHCLYLGIGASLTAACYSSEEEEEGGVGGGGERLVVVADSPGAVDYNIYDRAYEQAIKKRLEEKPSSGRPVMYLTKFVKEREYFKKFENIVESAMNSQAVVMEQVRETRESLLEHFWSPATTTATTTSKLGKLVAKVGLSDAPGPADTTTKAAEVRAAEVAADVSGLEAAEAGEEK